MATESPVKSDPEMSAEAVTHVVAPVMSVMPADTVVSVVRAARAVAVMPAEPLMPMMAPLTMMRWRGNRRGGGGRAEGGGGNQGEPGHPDASSFHGCLQSGGAASSRIHNPTHRRIVPSQGAERSRSHEVTK